MPTLAVGQGQDGAGRPEGRAPEQQDDDEKLLGALKNGDERAFLGLVERHHRTMVRVARTYVGSDAVAEEVAQEAWVGVLQGLEGFEGRCTLKSWIFRIVSNCAKTRGSRERRTQPISSLVGDGDEGPSVSQDRFVDGAHARWPGGWATPPQAWSEERCVARQTLGLVRAMMEQLPSAQREVVTLRDVEGWSSEEVCEALGISEGNQRVLLHRARSKIRAGLEAHERDGGLLQ